MSVLVGVVGLPLSLLVTRWACWRVSRVLFLTVAVLALALPAGAATPKPDRPEHWQPGKGNQAWQWRTDVWLPRGWANIARCETGTRWDWNSGTYQGAFGFYHGSWDQFKPVRSWPSEAYLASPWQQYQTALAIWRRYGLTGWGCARAWNW